MNTNWLIATIFVVIAVSSAQAKLKCKCALEFFLLFSFFFYSFWFFCIINAIIFYLVNVVQSDSVNMWTMYSIYDNDIVNEWMVQPLFSLFFIQSEQSEKIEQKPCVMAILFVTIGILVMSFLSCLFSSFHYSKQPQCFCMRLHIFSQLI